MKGWLIINSFMDSAKFNELYSLLSKAAEKHGVTLEMLKSYEVNGVIGDKTEKNDLPDFVLFWDKDIFAAKALEDKGLRLFNTSEAVYACDNKAETYVRLAKAGIRIPKTVIAPKTFEGTGYNNFDFLKKAIKDLGLPLIIKESYGSFGQQVYLAKTVDECKNIIKNLGHKDFLMQEFIESSCGRDVRINIVGSRAVASIFRYNSNDFRSNISNGGKMKNYTPTDEQISLAIASAKALKLDFAGVDIMFGANDEPIVCEVNSNPHFKSTLDCTGINLADSIIKYIISELDKDD